MGVSYLKNPFLLLNVLSLWASITRVVLPPGAVHWVNSIYNLKLFQLPRLSVQKLALIPAVVSQNVTNESYLVGVKSEKYVFWVTLRSLGSIRQGKA